MFHASGLLVVLIKARMLFAIERFLLVILSKDMMVKLS